jgi:hypothetical protein
MNGILLTIDFLQGELLSLSNKAEDHEPGDKIQARIEADCNGILLEIGRTITKSRRITYRLQLGS